MRRLVPRRFHLQGFPGYRLDNHPCYNSGDFRVVPVEKLHIIDAGQMDLSLTFNADLIRRYDKAGPRYTSYPTAVQFHDGFGDKQYRTWAQYSNEHSPGQPLSLYFHLPFCATVCYYCACNKIITKNRARAVPYLEHLHREIAMQGALFNRERKVEQLHWGGGTPTFIRSRPDARADAGHRRAFQPAG